MADKDRITLTGDNTPILICARCGKAFPSRGKEDEYALDGIFPVYCTDCEEKAIKELIGGPLDGRKVNS